MAKKSAPKRVRPKKGAWFVPVRGSYLPCSWQGWLLYVPFIFLIMGAFAPYWMLARSMVNVWGEVEPSALFFGLIFQFIFTLPYLVALVAIMTWIAKRKS